MVLFSLYLIVSATLLVQSFHSAGRSNFLSNANPLRGYQRIAFPQSKDSEVAAPPLKEQKRESSRVKTQHAKHSPLPLEAPKHKTCAGAMGAKPEWAKWTEWSPCSVSCGKGREIRWRHCVRSCDGMETEMEEKTCQLPACGGKLFGLIKL
ncbi:adhesion G protein-coupled receptor B2-like isoform X3 [Tenebrio molitor]|uniref:adhesion G protein-coupled receptor B2-like isoform X3 n=1 Tax=Tenebrio molitor TaxID=7067 RepID=UPI003624968B